LIAGTNPFPIQPLYVPTPVGGRLCRYGERADTATEQVQLDRVQTEDLLDLIYTAPNLNPVIAVPPSGGSSTVVGCPIDFGVRDLLLILDRSGKVYSALAIRGSCPHGLFLEGGQSKVLDEKLTRPLDALLRSTSTP